VQHDALVGESDPEVLQAPVTDDSASQFA
jgi:hypothetical protein